MTPVRISEDDAQRDLQDRQIEYNKVTTPIKDENAPNPVAPIKETPDDRPQYMTFQYLGTRFQVRSPKCIPLHLNGNSEEAIADGWKEFSNEAYNNLIIDCMKLRKERNLCDWSYLLMLRSMADNYFGKGTNEAALLTAFIFSQSGYKIRMGMDGNKLTVLFASRHVLYNQAYFECDGEKFYPLTSTSSRMKLCAAKFPKEQPLSLWVGKTPKVDFVGSLGRTLVAERYPEISVQVSVNKNLLAFYESYPSSEVGGNFMTRWAMYANTPMDESVKRGLYPALKEKVSGLSEKDAMERLLNWVQTAFVYEYDDKVWGHDRAFFAEETLYYPYCDCEDRSILLSRLVRDLLGLKCILIYYPGHLAMAVN